ncbi:hypothetical protein F511_43234 [Dorcoceras hygrometricum]|uniref:Secreted protein n=1 Tax=Dorcoceras hygrometricum TaxID=472368 RepID=A0A2Z7D9Q7_9LAMI|nr:hypothetical protein F511_43234 [Dorcoceras hygrometricum]
MSNGYGLLLGLVGVVCVPAACGRSQCITVALGVFQASLERAACLYRSGLWSSGLLALCCEGCWFQWVAGLVL